MIAALTRPTSFEVPCSEENSWRRTQSPVEFGGLILNTEQYLLLFGMPNPHLDRLSPAFFCVASVEFWDFDPDIVVLDAEEPDTSLYINMDAD